MTAPPNRITGYRSKAINAVRDFAVATAPVAGAGLASSDTPGGRVLSVANDAVPEIPRPWQVSAAFKATSSNAGEWLLRVHAGIVTLDGAALEAPAPDGTDTESGLPWYDIDRETFGATSGHLVVAVTEEDEEEAVAGGWELRREEAAAGETFRAIAWVDWPSSSAPKIRQLDVGVVDLGGGLHFGDAEVASTRTEWNQSEEVPAILEIPDAEGNVLVKVLVDSRGNIISWTSAGEDGEEPDDPSAPTNPPTCGNPLNDNDDSNPLDGDGGGGSGGGGGGKPDDHNPLDYEGDGGFTPKCA